MGSSASKRDITLVNDDDLGVVHISESLAHKLRDRYNESNQVQHEPTPTPQPPSPPPPPPLPPPPVYEPPPPPPPVVVEPPPPPPPVVVEPPPPPPPVVMQPPPPPPPVPQPVAPVVIVAPTKSEGEMWGAYAAEAQLSLQRLQKQQQTALQDLEEQWQQKMMDREAKFAEVQQLGSTEVARVADRVSATFTRYGPPPSVCDGARGEVARCYAENRSTPLNCAGIAKQFAQCVHQYTVGRQDG